MADLLSSLWGYTGDNSPSYTATEWESLLGQARRSALVARLALHFKDRGWSSTIPERVGRHMDGALRHVARQKTEVLWEIDQIRKALRNVQTPVVLLKGAAYLFTGLPPSRGRVFSDIDIMVDAKQLEEVERALFAAGWISAERDAYNQRYYRQWMHEVPPLRHVSRGTVIDLHHTISPPTSRFYVNSTLLLQQIKPLDPSGLFVLAPTDMVLHSAAHLYQEGEFDHALRDLLDMCDLITHFCPEPDFWTSLLSRAKEIGLQEPLFHALTHCQRLFGLPIPQKTTDELASIRLGRVKSACLGALLKQAFSPNHPDCDTWSTGLVRWLLYVRSHSIRMPLHLLLPHLARKAFMARFPPKDDKSVSTHQRPQ